jgi:hypothetical protein
MLAEQLERLRRVPGVWDRRRPQRRRGLSFGRLLEGWGGSRRGRCRRSPDLRLVLDPCRRSGARGRRSRRRHRRTRAPMVSCPRTYPFRQRTRPGVQTRLRLPPLQASSGPAEQCDCAGHDPDQECDRGQRVDRGVSARAVSGGKQHLLERGAAPGAAARAERPPAGRLRGPARWRKSALGNARGGDPPIPVGDHREHNVVAQQQIVRSRLGRGEPRRGTGRDLARLSQPLELGSSAVLVQPRTHPLPVLLDSVRAERDPLCGWSRDTAHGRIR